MVHHDGCGRNIGFSESQCNQSVKEPNAALYIHEILNSWQPRETFLGPLLE